MDASPTPLRMPIDRCGRLRQASSNLGHRPRRPDSRMLRGFLRLSQKAGAAGEERVCGELLILCNLDSPRAGRFKFLGSGERRSPRLSDVCSREIRVRVLDPLGGDAFGIPTRHRSAGGCVLDGAQRIDVGYESTRAGGTRDSPESMEEDVVAGSRLQAVAKRRAHVSRKTPAGLAVVRRVANARRSSRRYWTASCGASSFS